MVQIAQTNIQLYNQLRCQGRALEDILAIKTAYDFAVTVYGAYYQADCKPFVAHGVGVASILAHLNLPWECVAAGVLHNLYSNSDFGDARSGVATRRRRRIVREAVGPQVEDLLFRFRSMRMTSRNIDLVSCELEVCNESERNLLLMDLADYAEKYVDCGVLYFGQGQWVTDVVKDHGNRLVEIAHRLGYPLMASILSTGFAEAERLAQEVSPSLRASDGRKFLKLAMPRSCSYRFVYLLRRPIFAAKSKLSRTVIGLIWRKTCGYFKSVFDASPPQSTFQARMRAIGS